MSASKRIKRQIERTAAESDAELAHYANTVVCEVYAAHVIMMSADVDTADIFVQVAMVINATPPGRYACVVARGKTGQEFLYWTMPLPTDRHVEAFTLAWKQFSHEQPKMKKAVLDAIAYETRTMRENKVPILTGLWQKGIGSGPHVPMAQGPLGMDDYQVN